MYRGLRFHNGELLLLRHNEYRQRRLPEKIGNDPTYDPTYDPNYLKLFNLDTEIEKEELGEGYQFIQQMNNP